jgi:predicted dehydrogenase
MMAASATKVRWGVLGVASIAMRRAIPAMQQGEWCTIEAIASRDRRKAEDAAGKLGIAKAYGSYDELLEDSEIEAVYNPLPNNLHVQWSIRAMERGKHVLCEKPVGMNAGEVKKLIAARDRKGGKIGEAFMVRTHPRWLRTRELIAEGRIGILRSIDSHFSYFNRDPKNVRNIPEYGGGALLDIGCYAVTLSRFAYGQEPLRVMGFIERDPELGIDRLTSAIMEFPTGRSVFTCSTQTSYYQATQFHGTDGHIEIVKGINPSNEEPSRIMIYEGRDRHADDAIAEMIAPCNQFTIQGDLFSKAIRQGGEVPVPLEDSLRNMAAIDAIFRSAESGAWERPHA